MVEGKARERSLPILRSLSNATAEVPFLDLVVSSATGDNLMDVIERAPEGKTFHSDEFLVYMYIAFAWNWSVVWESRDYLCRILQKKFDL